MEVAFGTETGLWHRRQSDAHLAESIAPNATLFAVADGFGELGRGVATAPLALATIREYLRRRQRVGSFSRNVSPSGLRAILLAALDHANARLYAQSGSHEDFVGSGTSLTAVLVVGQHAFVGHVGDSRAYLLRLGALELLTADDAMFAGAAVTSAKSALPAKPRMRGLLWRSLGTQPKLEASIAHIELVSGDQLVLCTDGVHRCIDEDELGAALAQGETSADVVGRLLAVVKSRGNIDNGTLIVGRDLLVTEFPKTAKRSAGGPLRALLAIGLFLVALLSYGAYAFHPVPDRTNNTTLTDRP